MVLVLGPPEVAEWIVLVLLANTRVPLVAPLAIALLPPAVDVLLHPTEDAPPLLAGAVLPCAVVILVLPCTLVKKRMGSTEALALPATRLLLRILTGDRC